MRTAHRILIWAAMTTGIRTTVVALALSLMAILPTTAATIPLFEVALRFVGCEAVSGSYFTWSPYWHSTRDAAYDEVQTRGGPQSITWGANSPLEVIGGAPVYPTGTYEESGYATGDVLLVLLTADGTVAYEAFLNVNRPPDRVADFALRATVDCSSVPYRTLSMPDAAMPAPGPRQWLGTLLVAVATFVAMQLLQLGLRSRT